MSEIDTSPEASMKRFETAFSKFAATHLPSEANDLARMIVDAVLGLGLGEATARESATPIPAPPTQQAPHLDVE
jgi:hypothetical protein